MRGSVSIELLIILLVAVYLVLGVNRGFLDQGVYYAADVDRVAAMRANVDKLASVVSNVGYGGIGTRITAYIVVPPNGSISWQGNTIKGSVRALKEYNACPSSVCTYEVNVPFTFESAGSMGAPGLVVVEKTGPGTIRVST